MKLRKVSNLPDMENEEFDQIDLYLLGKMSETDAAEFSLELNRNPDLSTRVQIRKAILTELENEYKADLKRRLQRHDKSNSRRLYNRILIPAAAVLLVVLVGTLIFLNRNSAVDFAEYDLYEEGIPNFMNQDNEKIQFHEAMNHFKMGDFEASRDEFQNLLNKGLATDTILYYTGVSYYRTEELREAQNFLNQIDSASSFYKKAQFRSSVIDYQLGETEKAVLQLETIAADPASPYHEQALSFLRKVTKKQP